MSRQKRYLEVDVYTEAKRRIHHLYDLFDSPVVCFSGGKDSLTVLHLVWEVAQERGLDHVDAVFRDEELIHQSVLDFVEGYRARPWCRLLYFCYPLESKQYCLGVSKPYVQWDPHRRHARPIPAHALVPPPGETRVYDQFTLDTVIAGNYRGKVALLTGIRAAESFIRLRSSLNKLNENYITSPCQYTAESRVDKQVRMAKPIFDWEENDVFRYFYEQGIAYCPVYDGQIWARRALRVATPMLAESAKLFDKLKAYDPVLYAQVIDLWPEMHAHERYYHALDRAKLVAEYAQDLAGVRRWIDEHIADPQVHALAITRLEAVSGRHRASPEAYPLRAILNAFMSGAFKRELLPQGRARAGTH